MDDNGFIDVSPAPDLVPEVAPKRRGRPPKDPNAPRVERKPRTSRTRSLEAQIGGTLALFNLVFAFAPEPWQSDAMDEQEIVALAKSLDAAAKQNATMHKYLSSVLVEGGAMVDLVLVAGVIAGRRFARHGVIDAAFDDRLAVFLALKLGVPVDAGSQAASAA
jgi:hypothetical protein